MSSFTFDYPWVLLLIPIIVICAKKCPAKESGILFPHLALLKKSEGKKSFLIEFLKYSSIFLLIISLASPVKIDNSVTIKNIGYDIALCIDTSGSMKERGFDEKNPSKDKFSVVKDIVKDFITKRKNDNIALVVFGTYAYIASPLTYDKDSLKKIIDYIQIGIAGQKTAILDAIAQGIGLLKKSQAKSKILILVTDGIDTSSKIPLDIVIKMAKKYDIKIYTIGIGKEEDINKTFLQNIAKNTNGEFFYAKSAKSLKEVYKKINMLEKSEIKGKKYVKKDLLYTYTLFLSVLMLLIYIYIYGRRGV